MKRCMYCGQENEDFATACVKCGNGLLDIPADQMPAADAAEDAAQDVMEAAETSQDAPDADKMVADIEDALSDQSFVPQEENGAENTNQAGAAPGYYGQQSFGDPNAAIPGYGPAGYPQQGGPVQGYPGGGYAQQTGYPGAGYAPQGEGQSGFDNGYQQQGYAQQGYGQQGYAQQGYAQQGYGGAGYGYNRRPEYAGSEDQMPRVDSDYEEENSAVIMEKARKRVKSPLFFLAVVCYLVSSIGSIVYAVTGGALVNLSTLSNTIKSYTGTNIAITYFDRLINYLKTQETGNVFLVRGIWTGLYVPALLVGLAFLIAFSSTTVHEEENSTGGFTFARVILILKVIVICLLLLACIGGCVAYVVAAGAANSVMTLIIGVIGLLITVFFSVLTILFYIQYLFSIRLVRTNVRDGGDIGRIPGFAIFVGFVLCLFSVARVLAMAPDDYIGLVSGGATAVWLLLITIWAIVYRATVHD